MEPATLQPSVQIWAEQAPEHVLQDTEFVAFVRTELRPFATSAFNVRLLHLIAFSKKLHWLAQTNVYV